MLLQELQAALIISMPLYFLTLSRMQLSASIWKGPFTQPSTAATSGGGEKKMREKSWGKMDSH